MNNKKIFAPKRILIIKLRKLGDVLSTTPAVRQLRELYPNAEITFLTEPLGAKAYKYSTRIDRLIILNRKPTIAEYLKVCFTVFKGRYDLVINFYDHNKTALITFLSGAKNRFGYSKTGGKTLVYNHTVQLTQQDTTEVYCTNHQLKLTEILGTNYVDNVVEFEVSEDIREKAQEFVKRNSIKKNTIAFCVLSERPFAQVPVDLLISIGNYLVSKGFSLYFVYGPNEKEMALRVYNQIESKEKCIIDYEVPTIAEQRCIMEACCLFVGNDGGNKHLATTTGISTIGLFYSDKPLVWTPEDRSKHRFLQTKENENAFNEFKDIFDGWSLKEQRFVE